MASTGQDAVGSVGAGPEAARACHDLLVSLAGRVPDRALWRLRDWLAADADVALRSAVPRTLLRHRVGVSETERALLREAVQAWRGPVRLVDAVLHADPAPEPAVGFDDPSAVPWDGADLVLRALVPAVGDVGEVRRAWRTGPDRARVVLVSAAGDLRSLTGTVQRALRAHGDGTPCVEVIGDGTPTTGYHRAAFASSEVLWRAGTLGPVPAPEGASSRAPARPADPRSGPSSSPAELVRHG